jgi:Domain of unknown function (DUF4352)
MIDQQTTPSPGTTSPGMQLRGPHHRPQRRRPSQGNTPLVHKEAHRPAVGRHSCPVDHHGQHGGHDPRIFDFTTSAVESKAEGATKVTPADATIGESVRDGRFAFTVTAVQRPSKTLTDRLGATETAEGAYVIVRVSVTNIGYEARTLTVTDQFLVDNKGQRFGTSSAISSLAGAETIFLEKINPGHTVHDAPLLFDVPAGTTIGSIELHDSLSSTGVKVGLT